MKLKNILLFWTPMGYSPEYPKQKIVEEINNIGGKNKVPQYLE